MKTEYYNNKTVKLVRSLKKYLKKLEKPLMERYGEPRSKAIISGAIKHYPHIIPKIPYVNTGLYDNLLLLNSRMMALKKGMKDEGIGVEEFVKLEIEVLRKQTANIPESIKRLMGKLYLSRLLRPFLKRVGKSASTNDWTTQVIDGKDDDDFSMKIITSNCQMLNFMRSVGEGDIQPYCTFADFTTAETLGLGLKQISSIDSGKCEYCFYKNGKVEWPDAVREILQK
jgi:hypothetical protein